MAEAAYRLGVADPGEDPAVAARRLRDHLQARTAPGLLVLDNATDPVALALLLPATRAVRVLVSTNDQAVAELGIPVVVGTYTRSESLGFLTERTSRNDPAGAGDLAEALGDLPLALAQAAAVIRAHQIPYATYLERWSRLDATALLPARPGQPYPRGTAEAVLLSLQAYQDACSDPQQGLAFATLIAVLAPDGVHHGLLDHCVGFGPSHRPLDIDALVEAGTRFALVARAGAGDTLVMHRLTARVIRDHASRTGTISEVLQQGIALVSAHALPDDASAWGRRQDLRAAADHLDAIWAAGQGIWSAKPALRS